MFFLCLVHFGVELADRLGRQLFLPVDVLMTVASIGDGVLGSVR